MTTITTPSHHRQRSLVTPTKRISPTSSSPNKHVFLLIKVLFILIIILLLPQFVESKGKRNKKRRKLMQLYSELKFNCIHDNNNYDTENNNKNIEKECCKDINEAENEMCVSRCMNMECYNNIYGVENGGELEPGEVDEDREIQFENCVKDFLKKEIATISKRQ